MENMKMKWAGHGPIDKEEIDFTERLFIVKFPKEYKDIVQYCDGGTPQYELEDGTEISGSIDIENWGPSTIYMKKHHIGKNGCSEIVHEYNHTRKELPDCFFPFASDDQGNLFIFDYSKSIHAPRIYFMNHEKSITQDKLDKDDLNRMSLEQHQVTSLLYVADSFTDFISKIIPINKNK